MIGRIINIDAEKCNGCGACAPAYDEAAVLAAKQGKLSSIHSDSSESKSNQNNSRISVSQLAQWPCQIKLVPVSAPYFKGAELLIAADCTAYAYANFHDDYMKGRITLIGCPKLDAVDYSVKLTEILKFNDIKSIVLLLMEVPCCGGLEAAVKKALQDSNKTIPLQVVTLSINGDIL